MIDRDLYGEILNRHLEIEKDALKVEIEKMRDKLGTAIINADRNTSKEVLAISQMLDELIVKYLKIHYMNYLPSRIRLQQNHTLEKSYNLKNKRLKKTRP